MKAMHISEVLAEMEQLSEDGKLKKFSIAFVRSKRGRGGPKGSIKRVENAIKGTKPKKRKPKSTRKTGQTFRSYNGIPIRNLDNDELLTPKYTHIIGFNGCKVNHYGKK